METQRGVMKSLPSRGSVGSSFEPEITPVDRVAHAAPEAPGVQVRMAGPDRLPPRFGTDFVSFTPRVLTEHAR